MENHDVKFTILHFDCPYISILENIHFIKD